MPSVILEYSSSEPGDGAREVFACLGLTRCYDMMTGKDKLGDLHQDTTNVTSRLVILRQALIATLTRCPPTG